MRGIESVRKSRSHRRTVSLQTVGESNDVAAKKLIFRVQTCVCMYINPTRTRQPANIHHPSVNTNNNGGGNQERS
jgi:hypothetical protein